MTKNTLFRVQLDAFVGDGELGTIAFTEMYNKAKEQVIRAVGQGTDVRTRIINNGKESFIEYFYFTV